MPMLSIFNKSLISDCMEKKFLGKVDLIGVTIDKYLRESLISCQEEEKMKISQNSFDMSPYHASLYYV